MTAPAAPREADWLIFDDRWVADHGIGRVAREWRRLGRGWRMLGPGGQGPASPLDPAWLSRRLRDETLPFLSPGYNAPWSAQAPYFITVHDLCYLDLAGLHGRARQLYFATVVRERSRAARGVFTVSDFSRRRLIESFGLDPARVHVVTPGVSDVFTPAGERAQAARPYVLCVSNGLPHKNESRTAKAFLRAGLARTHDLLFTGTARRIDAGGDAPVHFTGRVDDARLAALYRGAEALVFASLYEGFGLPVVEAMACGTPVVCASTTALGEVAGDAARLVDPASIPDIAAGLAHVVRDPAMAARLRAAGPARAARFDWADGVRRVEACVRGALASSSVRAAEPAEVD